MPKADAPGVETAGNAGPSSASAERPLGVFDSGLGGLTVVRALRALLPGENIIYLGDTARVPYGTRSPDTIVRYARGCARLLTNRGIKALIVACNTASAVALDMLRADLDLVVLGVVHPGAQAAVERAERADSSRAPIIGVLGTRSTVQSGAYPRAVRTYTTRLDVVSQAAPLLVPLAEEGWLQGSVPRLAVERYLRPLIEAGARVIVLGCTHYPLLAPLIREVAEALAGEPVAVVDSALATATATQALLEERGLLAARERGSIELLATDVPASFQEAAGRFLGEPLPDVEVVDLV